MRRFVAIVTVVSCGASQAARPAEVAPRVPVFYVATRGDDRSTGSEDAPFATLARARDAARAKRGAREIIVRGGTYFLAAPLVLAPEDSGLVIRAFPGERVVLSGGARIEGFHETNVNGRRAWTAIVPGVKEGRA